MGKKSVTKTQAIIYLFTYIQNPNNAQTCLYLLSFYSSIRDTR